MLRNLRPSFRPLPLHAPPGVSKCQSGRVWHRDTENETIRLNVRNGATSDDEVVFPELSTQGAGSKFFLDPQRAAVRGGRVTSGQWDDDLRGADSVAFGLDTVASGDGSLAIGTESVASHDGALVWSDSAVFRASTSARESTFGATGGFRVYAAGATATPAYSAGQIYFDAAETVVTGKLTVVGIIDPTGLVVEGQTEIPGGVPAVGYGTYWCTADPTLPMYTDNQGNTLVLGADDPARLGAFVNGSGLTRTLSDTPLATSLVFGARQIDSSGLVGEQARWLFYREAVGALRAGKVTGTQWDVAYLGAQSVAFGLDTVASATAAFACGVGCAATGDASLALGTGSLATHDYSFVWSDGATPLASRNAREATFGCSGGFRVLGGATSGYTPGDVFLDSPRTVATGVLQLGGELGTLGVVLAGQATTPALTNVIFSNQVAGCLYYKDSAAAEYPIISPFASTTSPNNVVILNSAYPGYFSGSGLFMGFDPDDNDKINFSARNTILAGQGNRLPDSSNNALFGVECQVQAGTAYSMVCGYQGSLNNSNSFLFSDSVPRTSLSTGLTFGAAGGFYLEGCDLSTSFTLQQQATLATPGGVPLAGTGAWWSLDTDSAAGYLPVYTDAVGNDRVLGRSAFYHDGTVVTTDPSAAYYAADNSFVFGAQSLDAPGTQFQFDYDKASFRAGAVDSTQWADRGAGSCALGVNGAASAVGAYAFGRGSTATDANSLVWSDSTPRSSASTDSVTIGATGGMRVLTDIGGTTGVALAAGGTAWAAVSDRNRKENVREVVGVLDRLCQLPVYDYNYKGHAPERVSTGPMAQDWHRLFPSAKDPLRIDTMDLDGVKLAAIRELAARVRRIQALYP